MMKNNNKTKSQKSIISKFYYIKSVLIEFNKDSLQEDLNKELL